MTAVYRSVTMTTDSLDDRFETESANRVLDALSVERNRIVVQYFRERGTDVASLSDLARYVVEARSRTDDRSVDRTAVALHHGGLPKLTDAGLLEYDPRSETARRRDHPVHEVGTLRELLAVA